MVNIISPLELIGVAICGQYDRAVTAYTEHMRVGTNALGLANAKLNRELIVEGKNKAWNVLTHR